MAIPEEKVTEQKKEVLVCTDCFPPARFQSMRRIIKVLGFLRKGVRNLLPHEAVVGIPVNCLCL